jgi:O-antigen ligase
MLKQLIDRNSLVYYWGFIAISILAIMLAWTTEFYALLALPVAIIIGVITFLDFKKIFYFLLFLIPCSIEFKVTESLGTDLPTEPLIAGIMIAFFIYVALDPKKLDFNFFKQPVIIFITLQFLWAIISSINSINTLVSFKYLLAKAWYLTTFLGATSIFIKDLDDVKKFFWCIFIPLSILVIITLVRYYPLNFAFEEVNKTMVPYFRNKVNYGTTLTIFLPFIFLAITWQQPNTWKKKILIASVLLFLAGIYFSYTRACVLALMVCVVGFIAIKWKLMKVGIIFTSLIVMFFIGFMIYENEYMNHAPVFEKTIQHDKYEDHLAATVSFEDASSMERIYMWIGGTFMYLQHPIIGNGPNTFYPNYKHYTVHSFETYLSDNDEKLTVHNYFLLTLIEQGLVGFLLFICTIVSFLLLAQKYYHLATVQEQKNLIMACTMSVIGVVVNLSLSDLLEVDKIGSIYFMAIAMAINVFVIIDKKKKETTAILS